MFTATHLDPWRTRTGTAKVFAVKVPSGFAVTVVVSDRFDVTSTL
ncbi:hypothetical protein ABZX12_04370 [Kribbella sp. NPDC003505]